MTSARGSLDLLSSDCVVGMDANVQRWYDGSGKMVGEAVIAALLGRRDGGGGASRPRTSGCMPIRLTVWMGSNCLGSA